MSKLVVRRKPGLDNLRMKLAAAEGRSATEQVGPKPPLILADCSGSMGRPDALDKSGHRTSREAALAEILKTDFPTQEVYYFGTIYQHSTGRKADAFCGTGYVGFGTRMAPPIRAAKLHNHSTIILISDGLPNDYEEALLECKELTVHSIYVGPQPRPQFFADLEVQQKQAGHQSHYSTMTWTETKALTAAIKGLLC